MTNKFYYGKASSHDEKILMDMLSDRNKLLGESAEHVQLDFKITHDKEIFLIYKKKDNVPIGVFGAIVNKQGLNFCFFYIEKEYRRKRGVWRLINYIINNNFDVQNISSHAYSSHTSIHKISMKNKQFPTAIIFSLGGDDKKPDLFYYFRKGSYHKFNPFYMPNRFHKPLKYVFKILSFEVSESIITRPMLYSVIRKIPPSLSTSFMEMVFIDNVGNNIQQELSNILSVPEKKTILAFNMYDDQISTGVEESINFGYCYCGLIFNIDPLPRFCMQSTNAGHYKTLASLPKDSLYLYDIQ